MSSVIVSHSELPNEVYDLLRITFPDDDTDQDAFWPPDSVHALVYDSNELIAHAGFLERTLYLPERDVLTAYVEYVAAEPRYQGHGTSAMDALVDEIKLRDYTLAALGAASPDFYERLGWQLWRGPTGYRKDGHVIDMPDNEKPMVLDLGANVNLDARIGVRLAGDWGHLVDAMSRRPGDLTASIRGT